MTTIDKAYVEKLGEVLYDEKKAINYKTVSVMLGVHVNIAKQMLYHLHKAANEEKKKLYPTYYISGMMPREKIMALQKKQSDETTETSKLLSGGDIDAFLVTLCREKGLEELKAKFTKIFSIHMYSLSAFPIENYDVLNNLVEFPLRGSDGHTPVDFGPITCSASQKLLTNARPVPVPVVNDVSKTKSEAKNEAVKKSDTVKESGKDFFKSSNTNGISKNEETSKNGIVESKSQKVAKPAPPEKKDRLKSMFAAAATKPKTQKTEKSETKKPDTSSEKKSKAQEVKESSSEKSKNSRKRKRIRDVLSSDSEGEEKNSEDDEDSAPESPVQRKRIQIDSDSDDDVKESPTKTPEPEKPKEVITAIPAGRKRVAKMISKSYLDKDGFLVTTKEQVMVSEDEEDDEKSKAKMVKDEPRKPKVESKTSNGLSKSSPEKPSAKSTASKNASGKTKQASLMSFFQKK